MTDDQLVHLAALRLRRGDLIGALALCAAHDTGTGVGSGKDAAPVPAPTSES